MIDNHNLNILIALILFVFAIISIINSIKEHNQKIQKEKKEKEQIKQILQDPKSDQKRPNDWLLRKSYIKKRDEYKCALCGRRDNLQVHHKNPVKNGPDHSENNLITLCAHCHSKQEGHNIGLVNYAITKKLNDQGYKKIKARKEHRCSICNSIIQKDEYYYSKQERVDDRWHTEKICKKCAFK